MSTRRYTRRRYSTRGFVSRAIKRYALAILFVTLGAFIMGAVSYIAGLVPETVLTIGNDVSISNKLIINFIGWAAGILFILTGIRRFGIPI